MKRLLDLIDWERENEEPTKKSFFEVCQKLCELTNKRGIHLYDETDDLGNVVAEIYFKSDGKNPSLVKLDPYCNKWKELGKSYFKINRMPKYLEGLEHFINNQIAIREKTKKSVKKLKELKEVLQ